MGYHCGKSSCSCTHSFGCEFGWIWGIEKERKVSRRPNGEEVVVVKQYDVVRPCPNCLPEKAVIFAQASNRRELQEALKKQSLSAKQKDYEETERNKTKTL